MKVAILSDIHGNYIALEQVLKAAAKNDVQELLILGDFVGYYYHPDKVLDLLENWNYRAIRGNHEQILGDIRADSGQRADVKKKYGSGHEFALTRLTDEQTKFLINLPTKLELEIDNVKLLLNHGAPWDQNFYVYPDAKKETLEKCDVHGMDFVLAGHTHYAFAHRNEHSTFLNPGSVGQSRNQSGLAQWALINTENKAFEIRSTPYDISALIKEVESIDPENYFIKDVLIRNK